MRLCTKGFVIVWNGKLLRCCLWSDSYQSEKYANYIQGSEQGEGTQYSNFKLPQNKNRTPLKGEVVMNAQIASASLCVHTSTYAYTHLHTHIKCPESICICAYKSCLFFSPKIEI